MAYKTIGKLPQAIATLRQAVEADPSDAEALTQLGFLLLARNDLDGAVAACDQAIEINRKDNRPHQIRGKALLRKGALDESIAAYKRALALDRRNPEAWFELGNALGLKGALDEAAGAYREALRLKPDYAEARLLLGIILENQGLFTEALQELEEGHKQGSARPDWPYPSGQWVRECKRYIELDRRLPAVLDGKKENLPNAGECSEFARVCKFKGLFAAAARLYGEAFKADPEMEKNLMGKHRFYAAGAAALAGCGKGSDAPLPDQEARTQLRRQSLDWLRADLALWKELLATGKLPNRALVAQRMQQWQRNPDLALVRDPEVLGKLPEDERAAWRQLWYDVAALLKKAKDQSD